MYAMNLSLDPLLRQLKTGELQPKALIHQLCDRIEEADPHIHAFLPEPGRRERLLEELAGLERLLSDPASSMPLFGLPVGVKDIIRTEGFETRAGSKLPASLFDGPEARMVSRLRQAGALILGKTVTTEFAWFQPGPTRNPHHTGHTPGGSSSGSAAAVAAGMCPLSLGTQTIGSIGRPAAYCGITGFKPSQGRLPTEGIIPFSPQLDQPGFFAAAPEGLETVCRAIFDHWNQALVPSTSPRIGIPTGSYLKQAGQEVREFFTRKNHALKIAGYSLLEMDLFGDIRVINKAHRSIAAKDFARVHATWYQDYPHLYGKHSKALVEEGLHVKPDELEAALDLRRTWSQRLDSISQNEGIDLWLSPPATDSAPQGLKSTGSPLMNLPWTFTGMPTLVLPAGRSRNGLPLGLQATAIKGADEALLHWGSLLSREVPGP